jgi:hypothetical protein
VYLKKAVLDQHQISMIEKIGTPVMWLEPSRMGTYAKNPYQEFHVTRALSLLLAQQHSQ